MKNLLIFALIPLILSMGIVPTLPLNDAFALKSNGNYLTETGSKKVCGDRLCAEIAENNENLQVSTAEMLVFRV